MATFESHNAIAEYDSIALNMARKGLKGNEGDPLPQNISGEVYWMIFEDQESFQKRIRESAYMLAMEGVM